MSKALKTRTAQVTNTPPSKRLRVSNANQPDKLSPAKKCYREIKSERKAKQEATSEDATPSPKRQKRQKEDSVNSVQDAALDNLGGTEFIGSKLDLNPRTNTYRRGINVHCLGKCASCKDKINTYLSKRAAEVHDDDATIYYLGK